MNNTKAYKLRVNNLVGEYWHYDDIIVYADTAGEAKSKGLIQFDGAEVEDYMEYYNRRDVKFTDIKAYRHKELDKATYGGVLLTKAEIREKEWVAERDRKALELSEKYPDALAVVKAGCYGAYWGANRSGYSDSINFAGKYSTKEAYDIVRGSDYTRQETVELLDVENYNKSVLKQIEDIKANAEKEVIRLEKTIV